jgi:hypothetical protein
MGIVLKRAWSGTWMGPRPIDTGAGVYIWSSRRRHSFIPGLHTTVFQAKMFTIKIHVMKNITRKAT